MIFIFQKDFNFPPIAIISLWNCVLWERSSEWLETQGIWQTWFEFKLSLIHCGNNCSLKHKMFPINKRYSLGVAGEWGSKYIYHALAWASQTVSQWLSTFPAKHSLHFVKLEQDFLCILETAVSSVQLYTKWGFLATTSTIYLLVPFGIHKAGNTSNMISTKHYTHAKSGKTSIRKVLKEQVLKS